jgi:hypothetical protein
MRAGGLSYQIGKVWAKATSGQRRCPTDDCGTILATPSSTRELAMLHELKRRVPFSVYPVEI